MGAALTRSPAVEQHGRLLRHAPTRRRVRASWPQVATVYNDMHVLHINENFRWEKLDPMGEIAPPRWRHSATLLPDNNTIFIFGGLNKVSAPLPSCVAHPIFFLAVARIILHA